MDFGLWVCIGYDGYIWICVKKMCICVLHLLQTKVGFEHVFEGMDVLVDNMLGRCLNANAMRCKICKIRVRRVSKTNKISRVEEDENRLKR